MFIVALRFVCCAESWIEVIVKDKVEVQKTVRAIIRYKSGKDVKPYAVKGTFEWYWWEPEMGIELRGMEGNTLKQAMESLKDHYQRQGEVEEIKFEKFKLYKHTRRPYYG